MEHLADVLLAVAVYLSYRIGRSEREDIRTRLSAAQEKTERLYTAATKKIGDHIRSRMH